MNVDYLSHCRLTGTEGKLREQCTAGRAVAETPGGHDHITDYTSNHTKDLTLRSSDPRDLICVACVTDVTRENSCDLLPVLLNARVKATLMGNDGFHLQDADRDTH